MTSSINKLKTPGLLVLSALMFVISSCNKELEQFAETPVEPPSGLALGETLAASADDALFFKILTKANKVPLLNDKTKSFTIFSPSNTAVKTLIVSISGGGVKPGDPDAVFEGFIAVYLSPGLADTLVSYHILPQKLPVASIPTSFANFPYPTLFNPATALSALARLDAYTSRRDNGAWVNNIPVIAPDIMAANGVIHRIAAVAVPPSQLLLQRIATDTTLSFLMAAIIRADSGANLTGGTALQYLLGSPAIALGANFTVFAPVNQAFRNTLYALAYPVVYGGVYQQYLLAISGSGLSPEQQQAAAAAYASANAPAMTTGLTGTPDVFQNPALFPYLSPAAVKGILANHILLVRAFSVNLPQTVTPIPNLISASTPSPGYPGIYVAATFTGPVVTAATVKGIGNTTAANIMINPFPNGLSDQHYVNGVLHKIDQVLLPQ